MSFQVTWLDPEQTAIHVQFSSETVVEDMGLAFNLIEDLSRGVRRIPDVVIDLQNSGDLPKTANLMPQFRPIFESGLMRRVIFVGAPTLGRQLLEAYTRLYGGQMRDIQFADDLEDAQKLLNGIVLW